MSVALATTTAPYKALSGEDIQWLTSAEEMAEKTNEAGLGPLHVFVSLEIDSRGTGVYKSLFARLNELESVGIQCSYWTFTLNDHTVEVDGLNRLFRICAGRNLVQDWALRDGDVSHIFFVDSDLMVPADSVVKMMEVNRPLVGGNVPAYCLGVGHPLRDEFPFPVSTHWNTAGYLLVSRPVFRRVRWRTDLDIGMTDDPCYAADTEEAGFGPTWVRKDIIGIHGHLAPMEERGHDRVIQYD